MSQSKRERWSTLRKWRTLRPLGRSTLPRRDRQGAMRRFEAAYTRALQTLLADHGLPAYPDKGSNAGSGLEAVTAVAAGAAKALASLEKAAAAEGNGMRESGVPGPSCMLSMARIVLDASRELLICTLVSANNCRAEVVESAPHSCSLFLRVTLPL